LHTSQARAQKLCEASQYPGVVGHVLPPANLSPCPTEDDAGHRLSRRRNTAGQCAQDIVHSGARARLE
jgi:hypothetical protein